MKCSRTLYDFADKAPNKLSSYVIRRIASRSELFLALPFIEIPMTELQYGQPNPGNPEIEVMKILGDVVRNADFAHIDHSFEGPFDMQTEMRINLIGLTLAQMFITGNDQHPNRREFRGLQHRVVDNYDTFDPNEALVPQLKRLMSGVENCTHLLINKCTRKRLAQEARSGPFSGSFHHFPLYGTRVMAILHKPSALTAARWVPVLYLDYGPDGRAVIENAVYAVRFSTDSGVICYHNGFEVTLSSDPPSLCVDWFVTPATFGTSPMRVLKDCNLPAPLDVTVPVEVLKSKPDYAAITRAIIGR